MRTVLITIAIIGAIVVPFSLHGQARRQRRLPGYCIDANEEGDSEFVVAQAVRAFANSIGITDSVQVVEFQKEKQVLKFQLIKNGSVEQGTIVELEPTDPNILGGGALVWVDSETFCPIVLRRYQ